MSESFRSDAKIIEKEGEKKRMKKKKKNLVEASGTHSSKSLSSQLLIAFQRRRFLSDFQQIQVVDINTIERRRRKKRT